MTLTTLILIIVFGPLALDILLSLISGIGTVVGALFEPNTQREPIDWGTSNEWLGFAMIFGTASLITFLLTI